MTFPIIPLAAVAAILGGGYALGWYNGLTKGPQGDADRWMNEKARELYGRMLNELDRGQLKGIVDAARRRFGA